MVSAILHTHACSIKTSGIGASFLFCHFPTAEEVFFGGGRSCAKRFQSRLLICSRKLEQFLFPEAEESNGDDNQMRITSLLLHRYARKSKVISDRLDKNSWKCCVCSTLVLYIESACSPIQYCIAVILCVRVSRHPNMSKDESRL